MTFRRRHAAFLARLLCAGVAAAALPAAFALPTPQTAMLPSSPNSGRAKAIRTHRFEVRLPLANAFTLFEPIGEKLWAEGWNPVFASPGDAELRCGSVFTRDLEQAGKVLNSVWMVTHYDRPGGRIEYHCVLPGIRSQRVLITCREVREALTSVEVTYHYTGLSEEGDRFIASMTEEKFRQFIGEWDAAISAYLARGTPASL